MTIPNVIYYVLVLKCVRSWFFFISLLLFATIVYFILCEIYVKYLLNPIKDIRANLEKIIKDRGTGDDSIDQQLSKKGNEDDNFRIEGPGTELRLFRNKETRKLEGLLNFLKKILIMKQAHGNTDFKVQSKIYKTFLGFLDNLKEKDHYRQCLFIIAYSNYKDKNFSEAYEYLEILKKSTENEENEILSKIEHLEQKIINLPTQL